MTPTDHTLAAMTSLERARRELDRLWLECWQHCETESGMPLDVYIRDVVTELAAARDSLESAVECQLRTMVDDGEPEGSNVARITPNGGRTD